VSIDFSLYQAVLLDLDGTVFHDEHALPGAVGLIQLLQTQGRKFACISNSTASPFRIMAQLEAMGVNVDPDHIYTAAAAAADYVVEHLKPGARPRVYNLATESIQEMLDGLVDWVQTDAEPCDAVVIGAPANLYATDERQRMAVRLLRKGAAAVGICADRVYPSNRGLELGSGALTWMLAYAAAIEPVFCGKPQTIFFEELCKRLSVASDRCLIIGDNLESDVLGGKSMGMRTILTLTGVTRRLDLAKVPAQWQPDLVIEDLTALL